MYKRQELEAALGIPAGKLEQTVTDFNKMANDGYDPAFFRAAETMRAFGEGPFYAIEMIQAFLKTQGGARRNARAEVVGTDGEPIPHLYACLLYTSCTNGWACGRGRPSPSGTDP